MHGIMQIRVTVLGFKVLGSIVADIGSLERFSEWKCFHASSTSYLLYEGCIFASKVTAEINVRY